MNYQIAKHYSNRFREIFGTEPIRLTATQSSLLFDGYSVLCGMQVRHVNDDGCWFEISDGIHAQRHHIGGVIYERIILV